MTYSDVEHDIRPHTGHRLQICVQSFVFRIQDIICRLIYFTYTVHSCACPSIVPVVSVNMTVIYGALHGQQYGSTVIYICNSSLQYFTALFSSYTMTRLTEESA